MATSTPATQMYTGDKFVESAGTILFKLSTQEVCVLRLLKHDEYIFPKGRRILGESRQVTATRETMEETGIPCRLLPVNLVSRVCPAIEEEEHFPDEPRFFEAVCEPITLQTRYIRQGRIKLIWWFVAAVNEDEPIAQGETDKFEVEFHGMTPCRRN
jgi:8-oxo-dGTP pyrophosphatase MutT (NUDIX family)